MKKYLWVAAPLALLLAASSVPASAADVVVDVSFSEDIAKGMQSINSLEKRREKFFRRNYGEARNSGFSKIGRSRYKYAEFAGERLIPNLDDFTLENIIRRTVQHDIAVMDLPNKPARISVTLTRMKVSNYSLARFKSFSSVMTGTVTSFDASGAQVGSTNLTWEFLPRYTQDVRYKGSEYVYLEESIGVRIAPLTTGFIERALERLYPESDAPGTIILTQN
ncbi:MAG: hypothetical protein COB37_06945 [Kordiimonadales bacterium]|nr:MAG: hypothetical protein COB37_06945 [Kordiimonadales bacterium]